MSLVFGPSDDRCALESCGKPRDAHGAAGASHQFVGAAQLARRRPHDPFRNIRKMTDDERLGQMGFERHLVSDAPTPQRRKVVIEMPDQGPCTICTKPRTNHRGPMDHAYTPAGDGATAAPAAAAAPRQERAARPPRRVAARRAVKPRPRLSTDDKVARILELAESINTLRDQLRVQTTKLEELLA